MVPKWQAPESSLLPMLNYFAVIKLYEMLLIEHVGTQSFKKHFDCVFGIAWLGLFWYWLWSCQSRPKVKQTGKKKTNSKRLKYTMHINTGFTTLNIFLDFIILKLIVYSNFQKTVTFLLLVMDLCIAVLCLNLLKSNWKQPKLITSIMKECFRNYIHGRTFQKCNLCQEADNILLSAAWIL